MRFRPCIDLHHGIVKQIVGSTLSNDNSHRLETNFESQKKASWYAHRYRDDHLTGGHIIKLGSGNDEAALDALNAWPGGMQIGGGIDINNAEYWLNAGASAVIVTSWVFHDGKIDKKRLTQLSQLVGREHLVLDLSCRQQNGTYKIVTDRWQTFSEETICGELLDDLAEYAFEFLIHAVDVEGKCRGIETPLIRILGEWAKIPITYAGGVHTSDDIEQIGLLGHGHIDFTVGSALDIFGGSYLKYNELADQYHDEGV